MIMEALRIIVLAGFGYASAVALTNWAVGTRRMNPSGPWPRLIRRVSDPVLLPLERSLVRNGRNPQEAGWWLAGIALGGGLVLLATVGWLAGMVATVASAGRGGPRAVISLIVSLAFWLVQMSLLIRVIGSWLQVGRYTRWMRPFYLATDWIVGPIQRVMPPFGRFDFSPFVAYLLLIVIRSMVAGMFGV